MSDRFLFFSCFHLFVLLLGARRWEKVWGYGDGDIVQMVFGIEIRFDQDGCGS